MQCPFCENEARNLTPLDFDGKIFGCPNCREYDVADGYLEKLFALPLCERSEILDKAKRFSRGTWPSVNGNCFLRSLDR